MSDVVPPLATLFRIAWISTEGAIVGAAPSMFESAIPTAFPHADKTPASAQANSNCKISADMRACAPGRHERNVAAIQILVSTQKCVRYDSPITKLPAYISIATVLHEKGRHFNLNQPLCQFP
jgi:hypothetical protein